MGRTVQELLNVIQEAEKELAEIRSKCNHPAYFVGIWSWRVGAYEVSRICEFCKTAIPGITEAEKRLHDYPFTSSLGRIIPDDLGV